MADHELTAEYRCGYCYQEFNSMTDPKELPCHHVFCLTCLQEDYEDNGEVQCRICQSVHELAEFENLPTAALSTTETRLYSTEMACDNCEDKMAVSYCVNCGDKICDTHQQAHNAYFGVRHEVIPISVYGETPGKYKSVTCEQHDEELVKACETCSKLVCNECQIYDLTCTGKEGQHTYRSLNPLKEEITAHFNKLLKSASDKLTEICKLDKKIWRTLDEEEEACKENVELIELLCEEQIETIREESENLKEQVYDYQRRLTNQVEVYNSELMAKKEELEMSRTKVHRWLRESRVTEKIQQKQRMTDVLTRSQDVALEFVPLSKPVLLNKVKKPGIMHLATVPSSLTLHSEHKTNSSCYSAFYRSDGDLLIGCADGVKVINNGLSTVANSFWNYSVSVVVEHQRVMYVMSSINKQLRQVKMYLPGVAQGQKLFEFNISGDTVPFISVSDRYVAVSNPASKELLLYDLSTQQTITVRPDIPPWSVCFLPDGDLLFTAYDRGSLTRYQIVDGKLSEVWTFGDFPDALGVCTDDSGLIYVSSWSDRTICVISPQGQRLAEFKLDELPEEAGQISIMGDKLAVPGWIDETIHIFKLDYL